MSEKQSRTEDFTFDGGQVLDKVKGLLHEVNVRRITLKNEEGKVLFEIPLWGGLTGVALLPVLAAVGGVAAVVTRMIITVERVD